MVYLGSLLFKPFLRKVPESNSGMRCGISGTAYILTTMSADIERIVLLRNAIFGEIGWLIRVLEFASEKIQGDVSKSVIGVADLVGLVDVHHVDFVVPTTYSEKLHSR